MQKEGLEKRMRENRKRLPSRLRRLKIMLESAESLWKEDPERDMGDMIGRIRDLLFNEYRKLNWHTVSPIEDGCAREAIYEGSLEDCIKYTRRLIEREPARKNNLIITPV